MSAAILFLLRFIKIICVFSINKSIVFKIYYYYFIQSSSEKLNNNCENNLTSKYKTHAVKSRAEGTKQPLMCIDRQGLIVTQHHVCVCVCVCRMHAM